MAMLDVSTVGSHWAFPWVVILIIGAVSFYIVYTKEMQKRKDKKEDTKERPNYPVIKEGIK